jgi:hypothetical protein
MRAVVLQDFHAGPVSRGAPVCSSANSLQFPYLFSLNPEGVHRVWDK